MLNEIISSRTAKITQKVRDIPSHILRFVMTQRRHFIEVAQDLEIHLALNQAERSITVSGDREAVIRVVEAIKASIETFKTSVISFNISLPKRQHRLLVGTAVDDIMEQSKCLVVPASSDDASEEVTVWGKAEDLSTGMGAVIARANSQYVHEFPLPGPTALSKQLLTYMTRINYPKTLADTYPTASIFMPSSAAAHASVLNIDIAGEKSVVDGVVKQLSELIGKLFGATKEIPIDWLLHRVIQGKNAKKCVWSMI